MDAINLRWDAQPTLDINSRNIIIDFERSADKLFISVADNGIGMTKNEISQNLLDFGRNGWSEDPALDESAIDSVSKFKTIGKYGIGFFSVFMLGEKVEILSRRYDAALNNTLKLSFNGGIGTRPLLSYADRGQAFTDSGTKIRICIEEPQVLLDAVDVATKGLKGLTLVIGRLFPALDIPLTIRLDGKEKVIRGANWAAEAPGKLVARCSGTDSIPKMIEPFLRNLRPLFDKTGNIIGRLSIIPRFDFRMNREDNVKGVVMTSGVAVSSLMGVIGLIEGEVTRAARDVAIPSGCDPKSLADWLAEQSNLLANMQLDGDTQCDCASTIRSLGGDTGDLKICETSTGWLSKFELAKFLAARASVLVVQDALVSGLRRSHEGFSLNDQVIAVETGQPSLVQRRSNGWDEEWRGVPCARFGIFADRTLEGLIFEALANEWSIGDSLIIRSQTVIDGKKVYRVKRPVGRDAKGAEVSGEVSVFVKDMSEALFLKLKVEAKKRSKDM